MKRYLLFKQYIKIISYLLILSIVACRQTTTQDSGNNNSETNSDWNTFNQSSYLISYPTTWTLSQDGQEETEFTILSPIESDNDIFRENINLVIQDLSGQKINLDKYVKISESQIKASTNSTLIESKRMKNDSGEYHKVITSADHKAYQLKFEQYYWVVKNKAYVLTFTSEQDKFDDFKETGEKILNSFKLKKK